MKYYTVRELAKLINRSVSPTKLRIKELNLKYCFVENNAFYYSENQKNKLIQFMDSKKEKVYVNRNILIIPSKLNFLTLEQL